VANPAAPWTGFVALHAAAGAGAAAAAEWVKVAVMLAPAITPCLLLGTGFDVHLDLQQEQTWRKSTHFVHGGCTLLDGGGKNEQGWQAG